jgi:outer membrane protein TolC
VGVYSCRTFVAFLVIAGCAFGETHSLTLPQALELAARQNPDVTLARLDQQHAEAGIRVAEDPFHPKVTLGSGAAYTYGYPNTIEGSAPAVFQIITSDALFNRPKSYQVAAAKELARGSAFGAQAKTEEVAYQTADLFLTTSQIERQQKTIADQLPSLQKVVEMMAAAVSEGSQLPLELKRAKVNLATSLEQLANARIDQDYFETSLAVIVGYSAADRVKPIESDLSGIQVPTSEIEAEDLAIRNNRELRQMQSNILAKEMDLRSYKAARIPQVDLVAQYSLFAEHTYQQYFPANRFQRNNFQLGAAISVPVLVGTGRQGFMQQSLSDMQKLRVQTDQVRNRILSDTRRSYEQWEKAKNMRDLIRMKLDLAREELTVKLAQNAEGRTPLHELEQARIDESNFWMQLYDSETQVTRAKLLVLRETGTLISAVHGDAPQPDANRP